MESRKVERVKWQMQIKDTDKHDEQNSRHQQQQLYNDKHTFNENWNWQ